MMIRKFSFLTVLFALLVLPVGWSMAQNVMLSESSLDADQRVAGGGGDEDEDGDDPDRWAWLEDTYWYVPEENLKAFLWRTDKPDEDRVLSDQTVWHIERYDSGYIFGPTVINFNIAPNISCSYLNGSVTPPGKVYIAFTPLVSDESIPAITIGIDEMVNTAAGWTFAMQMATPGPTIPQIVSTEVEHWAFMEQCTRDSDCWGNLPGVDGGIDELFSQCDPPANR